MAWKGAWIIIFCSFLAHFLVSNTSHLLMQIQTRDFVASLLFTQGIGCLFYPLIGLVADIWFTRYRMLVVSALVQMVTSFMAAVSAAVWVVLLYFYNIGKISAHPMKVSEDTTGGVGLLFIIIMIVGMSIFEANAIQFGMDQLMEEPSRKITTFIQWYYWGTGVGVSLISLPLASFVGVGMYTNCTVINLHIHIPNKHDLKALSQFVAPVTVVAMLVQFFMAVVSFSVLTYCKKHFAVEPAGYNPFSTVYKVLKYSWQHKCPENRSAFTYWENDIPPRIDLGKNKYGGPFTTEEVEDTKTFLHILLLIISLFGFHLSGNGFTVTRQLMQKLCPSRWVLLLLFTSPPILDSLTTLVFIFTMQCLVLPYFRRCVPNLFKRLGLGLLLAFLQELVILVIAAIARTENYKYCYSFSSNYSVKRVDRCFESKFFFNVNGSCQTVNISSLHPGVLVLPECEDEFVSSIFSWILVPQVLHSLSSVLVFMTALEFICAQAPLRMKGLLIGVWYASFVLRYAAMSAVDEFIVENITWFIFHGVRAFFIVVSVLLYSCVAKRYHYRVRDEVVNERFLVEEIYERRLLQAEEYAKGKLHDSLSHTLQDTVSYNAIN